MMNDNYEQFNKCAVMASLSYDRPSQQMIQYYLYINYVLITPSQKQAQTDFKHGAEIYTSNTCSRINHEHESKIQLSNMHLLFLVTCLGHQPVLLSHL